MRHLTRCGLGEDVTAHGVADKAFDKSGWKLGARCESMKRNTAVWGRGNVGGDIEG